MEYTLKICPSLSFSDKDLSQIDFCLSMIENCRQASFLYAYCMAQAAVLRSVFCLFVFPHHRDPWHVHSWSQGAGGDEPQTSHKALMPFFNFPLFREKQAGKVRSGEGEGNRKRYETRRKGRDGKGLFLGPTGSSLIKRPLISPCCSLRSPHPRRSNSSLDSKQGSFLLPH